MIPRNLMVGEELIEWPLMTIGGLGSGIVLPCLVGSGTLLCVNVMRPDLLSSNFELCVCAHSSAPCGRVIICFNMLYVTSMFCALATK